MPSMPLRAKLYLATVSLGGVLAVVTGLIRLHDIPAGWVTALTLALLVVLAHFAAVPLSRSGKVAVTVAQPVAIASVLLLGAAGAPFVVASSAFAPGKERWYGRLFNFGMSGVAAWAASLAFAVTGGVPLLTTHDYEPGQVLVPGLVATLVLEVVNGLLMVGIVVATERISPLRVWYGTLAQSALPMFIYSIFGLLLAVVWSFVGPIAAVLVLAPLTVARWVFAEFALRQEAYEATMRSLIKSVETKDLYTRGHSERVSRASVLIGRRAGMREDRVSSLRYAGMLHDVGKLGVPTSVLQKSGRLTDDEYEAIQQHTVRGREIVKDLEFLGEAIEGILLHHERIDGRGYPMGKVGAEIPEFARIIAVADAFDSMTTTRSYRGARSIEDAFEELRRCKGSQFDPVMVEALIEAVEAEGWDASDTLPVDLPQTTDGIPTLASDDDDPTVADRLGIPSAAPGDASELDGLDDDGFEGVDDELGQPIGGEHP